MTSAILDTPDDDCVLAGLQAEDAQCETQGSADPTESFVQKTFGPATDSPFEEGRPWSPPAPDPFLAAFKEHLREAEALETQIGNNESSADQLLAEVKGIVAPLERQQILACYRAWKLVVEGNVPVSTMEEYTLTGGVKAHGNEKIPCSRLMRAIVKSGVITGTRSSQNKRARASTNASAIDFGIQKGMSEEEFAAELDQRASEESTTGSNTSPPRAAKSGRPRRPNNMPTKFPRH